MAVRIMCCYARSGGTVLNQCLGSLPDVWMLSEVSPLGGGQGAEGAASPTTVAAQASRWFGVDVSSLEFGAAVAELHDKAQRRAKVVVVRDWSFVSFTPCSLNGDQPARTFMTVDAIAAHAEVIPFVFVRDAIDVWLSRGVPLPDFAPHYLAYVQEVKRRGWPIFRYEAFCANPEQTLRGICDAADIPFSEDFLRYAEYTRAHGDTQLVGASRGPLQGRIAPLIRRFATNAQLTELAASREMAEANALLGYPTSYGAVRNARMWRVRARARLRGMLRGRLGRLRQRVLGR